MRLASARGLGSEAGLPGERASWPGTSPCAWAGGPGPSFPPCKAETPEAAAAQGPPWCLQRRGRLWALATPWPRAASAAQAAVKPAAGPCGVGLPQGGGAAGLAAAQHLPSFPRPVTRSCLPSPRVLGPSAPSSSPGLIGRTLTLAADGAQSSSAPGRKRHTNRADRCISNSERSTKGARWLPRFVTGRSPSRLGPRLTSAATVWPPPGSWAGHTATGHHGARAVFRFYAWVGRAPCRACARRAPCPRGARCAGGRQFALPVWPGGRAALVRSPGPLLFGSLRHRGARDADVRRGGSPGSRAFYLQSPPALSGPAPRSGPRGF